MISSARLPGDSLSFSELVQDWQSGRATRHQVTQSLVRSDGAAICALLQELSAIPASSGVRHTDPLGTDAWREELLACKARAWNAPDAAGLLVGPSALMLSDGERAVILDAGSTRHLPAGLARSLLLLAQTIVMADDALDVQEIDGLRRGRVQAASTSLSEIQPIE